MLHGVTSSGSAVGPGYRVMIALSSEVADVLPVGVSRSDFVDLAKPASGRDMPWMAAPRATPFSGVEGERSVERLGDLLADQGMVRIRR